MTQGYQDKHHRPFQQDKPISCYVEFLIIVGNILKQWSFHYSSSQKSILLLFEASDHWLKCLLLLPNKTTAIQLNIWSIAFSANLGVAVINIRVEGIAHGTKSCGYIFSGYQDILSPILTWMRKSAAILGSTYFICVAI